MEGSQINGEEELRELLISSIREEGPMTFAQFMETVLYHPNLGYYTDPKWVTGREGDFFTSCDLSSVFGQMLAKQVNFLWEKLDKPGNFKVVEYGAGRGYLARDILEELRQRNSDCFEALTYYIIEKSHPNRHKQQECLATLDLPVGKVLWVNKISEVSTPGMLDGLVLSNELIDAFAVHVVQKQDDLVQEVFVDIQDGELVEVLKPVSNYKIVEYLKEFRIELEEEQRIEVNLQALDWLAEIANTLDRGMVLTVDYGYTVAEIQHGLHFNGTLRGFYQHQLVEDPFKYLGRQDLTASVNFTALIEQGEALGLKKVDFLSQGRYLSKLGILEALVPDSDGKTIFGDAEATAKAALMVKRLILPGMGEAFKVLLQGKSLIKEPTLGL